MTTDEQVEESEALLRHLDQLPYRLAQLMVTELRTCRRVLREIKKLAAPRSRIATLAIAALKEPPAVA